MASVEWFHGGDLEGGEPWGTYLYLTCDRKLAKGHAGDHPPNGKVYRLRAEYHHLVMVHPDDLSPEVPESGRRRVIRQRELPGGGALAAFEVA